MGNVMGTAIRLASKRYMKEDLRLYAQKHPVEGLIIKEDIAYADQLYFDYYVQKEKAQQKKMMILDIHGGAWIYGDKKLNQHFCMNLAKRGFSVFNMNYQLVPYVTVKEQIKEIFQALHYIIKNEKAFDVEHAKICLSGDSAGAHLASLAACISKDPHLQKLYGVEQESVTIDALLLQHGIYDLQMMVQEGPFYMNVLYHLLYPKEDVALRSMDSLSRFLDKDWDIPMFLLSSEQDQMFSKQTLTLAKRLDALSVPYQMLYWDKAHALDHVFHISHPDKEESQRSFDEMAAFLNQLL